MMNPYIYRASELGACFKAQVARRSGYTPLDPPAHMLEIFERGNVHEDECVAAMLEHGWAIFDQQRVVEIPVGQVKVRGHLDGIVEEYGVRDDRVLEIKSPNAWRKFERATKEDDWSDPLAQRYAWQISVYMHALQKEALIACVEDSQVHTFVIEKPPISLDDIYQRVNEIEKIASAYLLPTECSSHDYPCPFVYLHEDTDDTVEDTELDKLVALYDQAVADEKIAKARKDEYRAAILEMMGDRTKVETASAKVSVYEQAAPARINEDRMRADGINPDDYKVAGSPSTRIKITSKGA